MGYYIHQTIVVTSWEETHLRKAHNKSLEFFEHLTSEVSQKQMNGFLSFCIFPDGSKEGWSDSDECNEKREKFKDFLKRENLFVDWVEVVFGGDEPDLNTKVFEYGHYIED